LEKIIKQNMKTIIELEAERLEWSLKNFPDATPRSSMLKLQGEAKEVLKEISKLEKFPDGDDGLGDLTMEYADCLMCLFDSVGRAGVSVEEIFEAFEEKLRINKARKWVKNKDNTYSHIKATTA
jgi:NTP pyrophosphatase (non-canonical NTP hydrolase)